MINGDDLAELVESEFRVMGYTDDKIAEVAKTDQFFCGCSEVAWKKLFGVPVVPYLKYKTLSLPSTVGEFARVCVATMSLFEKI